MNSKVVNMQPYYSSYSRLLDYYFFFFLYSLSLPICGFLLSPLSLYFLDFSLSSSHSPSPPTLMVWWWQTWWMVSISQTSLSLSLSDLVGITMFVGVWWWVFGGGGCLMVGICYWWWWWWCRGGYGYRLFCYGESMNRYGYKK